MSHFGYLLNSEDNQGHLVPSCLASQSVSMAPLHARTKESHVSPIDRLPFFYRNARELTYMVTVLKLVHVRAALLM